MKQLIQSLLSIAWKWNTHRILSCPIQTTAKSHLLWNLRGKNAEEAVSFINGSSDAKLKNYSCPIREYFKRKTLASEREDRRSKHTEKVCFYTSIWVQISSSASPHFIWHWCYTQLPLTKMNHERKPIGGHIVIDFCYVKGCCKG